MIGPGTMPVLGGRLKKTLFYMYHNLISTGALESEILIPYRVHLDLTHIT